MAIFTRGSQAFGHERRRHRTVGRKRAARWQAFRRQELAKSDRTHFPYRRRTSSIIADVVEDWSKREPDRLSLISETGTFTYQTLAERINRYARWALSAGIEPGDTVCLFMPSRPDYLAAWLGITKVGGVVALINTKLVGRSLSHCINVADADHVFLTRSLQVSLIQPCRI